MGQELGSAVVQPDMLRWSMGLSFVMLLMFLCIGFIKRTGWRPSVGGGQLRIVAGLSLGSKERLLVVQVGDKQLILGVAPGLITQLGLLEGDSRLQSNVPEQAFSLTLQRYIGLFQQKGQAGNDGS